ETDKVAVEVPSPDDGVLTAIILAEGDDAAPGAVLGTLSSGAGASAAPVASKPIAAAPRPSRPASAGSVRAQRLSPLVARLRADNRLVHRAIKGTGRDGSITHEDVEAYLKAPPAPGAQSKAGDIRSHRVRHDSMRRFIAEHMTRSVQTAPHVTSVFEADF